MTSATGFADLLDVIGGMTRDVEAPADAAACRRLDLATKRLKVDLTGLEHRIAAVNNEPYVPPAQPKEPPTPPPPPPPPPNDRGGE